MGSVIAGFVTATTLMLVDRVLISSDWYNEGKIIYLEQENAPASDIRQARIDRFSALILRAFFGAIVSFAVTEICSWGAFPNARAIFVAIENTENPELGSYRERVEACEDGLESARQAARENATKICETVDRASGGIQAIQVSQTQLDSSSVLPTLQKDYASVIDALNYQRCALQDATVMLGVEINGGDQSYQPKCVLVVRDDTRGGKGDQYQRWVAVREDANRLIPELVDRANILSAAIGQAQTRENAIQTDQKRAVADALQVARSLNGSCSQAQLQLTQLNASFASDYKMCTSGVNVVTDPILEANDLGTTIRSVIHFKKNNSEVFAYILWIKIFVIFLELSVFVAKFGARVPGYSMSVYRDSLR